jgi:uncharacterized protein
MLTTVLLLVSALIVGVLVGCVAIGGVLLPPTLVYMGGFDPHLAMATSMWSFLFTGVVGTAAYSRRGSVDWRMVLWLSGGIVPAALLGAHSNVSLPAGTLMTFLAILIFATGINSLSKPSGGQRLARSFGAGTLLLIGALVGFGSALTGTGGPVLLVPILVYLRGPILAAVGAGQVVQIPVALSATVGYVLFGEVDFVLGTALGFIAMVGVAAGARIAHMVPASTLRHIVAVSLVATGLLIMVRNITGF